MGRRSMLNEIECRDGLISLDQLITALRALIAPAYDPLKKGGDL